MSLRLKNNICSFYMFGLQKYFGLERFCYFSCIEINLRICMHLSHLKAKHTTLHSNKRWKTSKKWTKNEKSLNKSLFECIMNSWFVLNRFTWASKILHATKQNIGNPLLIAINIFAHSHTQHIAHLCHIRNAIETSKLRKILWKYR